ncbi:ABC transporter permease [Luteipulveratus mongoliensis]|uniref:ABC transporter permease n=1 Tax=Luteipulveratus mongoliensis TaxID=571913 RepID=UPI0006974EAA|nr:ABC transporter permease [Luteipulveratus mongoliensis]
MSTPTRRGVIHDLGYRPFTGRRQSRAAIARSLYLTSLRYCFGIGRSGKSKVMPWLMTAVLFIPALVLAGIIVQLKKMSLQDQSDLFAPLSNYFGYPYWTQLLLTIFVAAQGPVLFARDLRYRTIVLYFARPLSRVTFVLVRLAALTTAVFAILAVPMAIWYAVALSSDMDNGEHTRHYLAAMAGVAILSLILSSVSALVSALTTRTGLAVTAIIIVLMVTSGMVTAILGVAYESQSTGLASAAAAANPFTAVASLISGLFDQATPVDTLPRPTNGWTAYAAVACLLWVLVPTALLLQRTRKAASL